MVELTVEKYWHSYAPSHKAVVTSNFFSPLESQLALHSAIYNTYGSDFLRILARLQGACRKQRGLGFCWLQAICAARHCLQCVAVCCSVCCSVQCVAVCCSVLQCVAAFCIL